MCVFFLIKFIGRFTYICYHLLYSTLIEIFLFFLTWTVLRRGVTFDFGVGMLIKFVLLVPNNSFIFCDWANLSFDSSTSTLSIFVTPIWLLALLPPFLNCYLRRRLFDLLSSSMTIFPTSIWSIEPLPTLDDNDKAAFWLRPLSISYGNYSSFFPFFWLLLLF